MASTWRPARASARTAGRPVRMLTSCSGDGPPKMTAGRLTNAPLVGISREMVGQVVLVQDDIARRDPGGHPCDSLLPRGGAHHRGRPARRPVEKCPGVGLA